VDLLLLSSSRVAGGGYLEYAREVVADLLTGCRQLVFVPFALADQAGYTAQVRTQLHPFGVDVVGLEGCDQAAAARRIAAADAIFVGGGNSFRLLKRLQALTLLGPIRARVSAGELRYMGSSAGTNMACPSLRTTNDMPIVRPASFRALGLVPFQINPHYLEAAPDAAHMGETRDQRILEFLEENDVPVVGLREGAWLRRRDHTLELGGIAGARLFTRGRPPRDLAPPADLSDLLRSRPRYDVP
jgi:dipeptidase E